ncbi:MFS transporter [Pandoraea sputorum]|uniref:MFS transporter n=1 Tax=Pandoraea sputorum TaxID=93222 RepID=A0A5E5BIR0_9BURK|nr:MFS transporter [Pandoraea sputorum]VVE84433.1 MFS transporter [Pandoraea sputorum]
MRASKFGSTQSLSYSDYKVIGFTALGGTLEFYDFVIFVFFIETVGKLFFPATMSDWLRQLQSFGIFAAGYLTRPLGGLAIAYFGDVLGRRRTFMFSLSLMALPTLAIGLLPTYDQIGLFAPVLLLVLRLIQGAAVGGEMPAAWVFVAEHVPDARVGRACGIVGAGACAGLLFGSIVAWAIHRFLPPHEVLRYGWRLPFLLGGLLGVATVSQRRKLRETPVFQALQRHPRPTRATPLKVLARHHRCNVLRLMALSAVVATTFVVVMLMTPTLLQHQYALPAADIFAAHLAATLALVVGCVAAGTLVDRVGPRTTLTWGFLLIAASNYALQAVAAHRPAWLLALYLLTGFALGTVGAMGAVFIRAFPASVRCTGVSFSYNLPYALLGGVTPLCASYLSALTPLGPAHYVGAACALGVLIAQTAALNDTSAGPRPALVSPCSAPPDHDAPPPRS